LNSPRAGRQDEEIEMKTRVIATLGMLAASPAAAQKQDQAQLAQQQEGYNRALAACMKGRGYSVG
jgi:hypothetical protein